MPSSNPPAARVLVVGDLNPDLVLHGDVEPRFGQAEQLLDSAALVVGGSAGITAHGLARLARPVSLLAAVGADQFGAQVRDELARAGVDVSRVLSRADESTGLSVVLSRRVDRAILTLPGTIPTLTGADVERAIDEMRPAGLTHLHIASLFLQPKLAAELPVILAHAQGAGLTVSLDTNDDPARTWLGVEPLLAHVDLLLPNRAEAIALAAALGSLDSDSSERSDGDGRDEAHSAAVELARRGPIVVVKDGAGGAFAVDPDGSQLEVEADAVAATDTTGAGDTFDAAFIDAWLDQRDRTECLARAVRAGAFSVARVGGTAGQPTRADLSGELNRADPAGNEGKT